MYGSSLLIDLIFLYNIFFTVIIITDNNNVSACSCVLNLALDNKKHEASRMTQVIESKYIIQNEQITYTKLIHALLYFISFKESLLVMLASEKRSCRIQQN